jgi:DTW domain-containing protein YfiP
MHPREAYHQKTGTGRLASLSLIDSEIIIGVDFTENKRFNTLISGQNEYADYYPVVLYPATDAYYTDTPEFRTAMGNKKLMVILIDATWYLAQKMIKLSANVRSLPALSFSNEYRSQFQIKKQPDPVCLSTIETTYYLIDELKAAGIVSTNTDHSGLMKVFYKMISFQKSFKNGPRRLL